MTLDHLNIYRHPYKTCQTVEVYLESSKHLTALTPLQNARMLLAYARAALLLDYTPLANEQIIDLYITVMKEGLDQDKFEMRLFISDLFQYLDDGKTSMEWLEDLENDKVLGLTPDQASRIHHRLCQHFLKMQQLHIAYNSAKSAHSLALMTDSVELIVMSLMQLSSVSRLNGDYVLSRQYLSKAKKLSELHKVPWLTGKCLLELGEVDQFLGARQNALNLYKDAQRVFEKIQFSGGYARASMNLLSFLANNAPDSFSDLLKEVCTHLGQMKGSDPYRLWINVQALGLYDHLLDSQTTQSMEEVQRLLKEQIQKNVEYNQISATTLLTSLETAKYELDVLKQAESSTRLSVGAIDFYRSSVNKRIDTASHEIRNAVSILKMSVEAVKDGHVDLNKGMIETMLKKIESIGCIVDELDLEDQDADDRDNHEPFQTSVDHIASYCEMAYAYTDDRVHIHRDGTIDDTYVVATLLPVTQVIDNLISNALKYSPTTSKVHIHYEEANNFITFHILDQGCGISDQDQIHIFEPYFRVKNSDEDGKGLGLHYCRQTIQTLGGDIWVKSHLGRGSEFSFSLPIKYE